MTTSADDRIADAISRVASARSGRPSIEATLEGIIRTALVTVPNVDGVSVTVLHPDGRVETVAATDDRVRAVDEAQSETCEGPCIEALQGRQPIVVDGLHDELRWPKFAPRAHALGVTARMGALLFDSGDSAGAINFYSCTANTFNAVDKDLALVFARESAKAIDNRRADAVPAPTALDLHRVYKAIGIVMERYTVNEETASRFLARMASKTDTPISDLVVAMVRSTNLVADKRSHAN